METLLLITAAFVASLLSGVYGMAGGLVLLAVYLMFLPTAKVMLLHGLVMFVACAGRAVIARDQLLPSVLITGAVMAPLLCWFFISHEVVLPKPLIYILVGITSFIVWLPPSKFSIPVGKKRGASVPTAASLIFTLSLGAAGPMIDAIFLQSGLNRAKIMANKAFLQVLAHGSKIIVYGGLTLLAPDALQSTYTPLLLGGSLVAALAGTWAGNHILQQMSENFFTRTSRWLISAIAVYYVVQGVMSLG
ncbi:MAG: hypothetical protein EBR79_03610 [Proteobacteria bacterium]|nr:hypothetical protein [Pseudomonadota bacterium]NBX86710.1 hypothetical protein [Pseudomonadota bacterium]